MLVVIGIMLMMVALAATLMQPASESRRARAARAVNLYSSSARNPRVETGRPCGVIFRCFSTTSPGFSLNADQCEVPPCYCGEQETSTATVQWVAASGTATLSDSLTSGLVKKGDLIQFNYQGPMYAIQGPADADNNITGSVLTLAVADVNQNPLTPWTATASQPLPYRIFRLRSRAGPRRCNCPPLPSSISRRQATVSTTSASKT